MKHKLAEAESKGINFEVRQDDIFPLADAPHHYWSGFFTSRPALKKQVHVASAYLAGARQLEQIFSPGKDAIKQPTTRPSPIVGGGWTDALEGTVGVATHHDGMSGTERQSISNDFSLRISESQREAEQGVALAFGTMLGSSINVGHCNCNTPNARDCLNATMCPATTGTTSFKAVFWNSLAHTMNYPVSLPVSGPDWSVHRGFDKGGTVVTAATAPLDNRTLSIPLLHLNSFNMTAGAVQQALARMQNNATHVLQFVLELPPLGYSAITAVAITLPGQASKGPEHTADDVTISNKRYRLRFTGGYAVGLENLKSGKNTTFGAAVLWYNSSVGGCTPGNAPAVACDPQASGAYIFRPNYTSLDSALQYPGPPVAPTLQVRQNSVVQEVVQTFSSWASLVYRLWQDKPYLEVEWTVGPIPVDTPWLPSVAGNLPNKWGKEVIVRYHTGLNNAGVFYTDSNGRELVKRVYNGRGTSYPPLKVSDPVAGNYYPVNSIIGVRDEGGDAAFSVVTDVAQGGTAREPGAVEVMVHRRLQADDNRGIQEPLNETMCGCNDVHAGEGKMGEHGQEGDGGCECQGLTVRGKHLLLFDSLDATWSLQRRVVEELIFPPVTGFISKASSLSTPPTRSYLQHSFPPELKLMTLTNNYAPLHGGKSLLRVAHLYGVGESKVHSVPVALNFSAVFNQPGLIIETIQETQLTATMNVTSVRARRHHFTRFGPPNPAQTLWTPLSGFTVTVRPMEVRTFLVTFLHPMAS